MKLQRQNRLRAITAGALAVAASLAMTSCGSDDNSGSGSGDQSTGHVSCHGKGQLLASGSTAQKNAQDLWVKNYDAACKGTTVNYKGTGSGAGIQEFLQGKTAFAGSDSALEPDQIAQSKKVCKGGQGIDLPMVPGPIAIGFNVPGVKKLVLNAQTLAQIFDSKIKTWNDPAIKKLNPGVKLPGLKIQPFHRSDDSGTTDNFTRYLKATAPADWKHTPGKTWSGGSGQSADGSSGLAAQVKQVSGAISYFELSYATSGNITTADLDTGAGTPVKASTAGASKAIAQAQIAGKGDDLALKLAYDTKTPGAYPLALVTYEIVCNKGNKASTLTATRSYLDYIASKDAQKAIQQLGYAPLPSGIETKVRDTVASLS